MDDAHATPAATRLAQLAHLTALGMQLADAMAARALRDLAAAPELSEGAAAPDPSRAFGRIARVVRQTMALHARLEQGPVSRLSVTDRAPKPHGAIRRAMARRIAAEADPADAERLLRDLDERLSDPAFAHDLATRPQAYILARLNYDLDLPLDVTQLDDEILDYLLEGEPPDTDEDEAASPEDPPTPPPVPPF